MYTVWTSSIHTIYIINTQRLHTDTQITKWMYRTHSGHTDHTIDPQNTQWTHKSHNRSTDHTMDTMDASIDTMDTAIDTITSLILQGV